jgi:hypothetical protein
VPHEPVVPTEPAEPAQPQPDPDGGDQDG